MKISHILAAILFAAFAAAHAQDNFADTVVSYVPGTGENTLYENSSTALGAPTTGSDGSTPYSIIYPTYENSQMVGVGNGGELTLGFNTSITNDPTDHAEGMDFTIFGNEFFVNGSGGTFGSTYDHPGLTVWVSQDDTNFYELDVPSNAYGGDAGGADAGFPEQGNGNPLLPINPALALSSFYGLNEGQALSLTGTGYDGSAGGASYSISWAVNAEGQPVDLSWINEIKIEGSGGYGYVDAVSRVENIQGVPEPSSMTPIFAVAGMGALILFRSRRLNPERKTALVQE